MTARVRAAQAVGLVVGLVVGSGCGTTMRDLPLPGTGVSGDTIEIKAEFTEALNLAEGAPVKVNGVDMGKVEAITVEDFTAEATLTLEQDAGLRAGAHARLRYTTPLGEIFVDVTNPSSGALLAEGDKLTLEDTRTAPTVEDALAQASLLINGGGLDQLQTVTEELNAALDGNEADYRRLLDRATVFLTQANATTGSIDRVLGSLDSLSKTLSARERTINRAVREIRPAARVLRQKTPELTRLLAEVERFSAAANSTVTATRAQLITMLEQVEPVLAELAANHGTFDRSLRAVITAAGSADEVVATDYLNISLQLHLDGLDANGLVEGTLAGLLSLIGLDPARLGLPLGALPGGSAPGPSSGRRADPAGLGGLLGGLLGGRS